MKINVSELKNVVSKMNGAIEKSKINPKSGWVEIETVSDNSLAIKMSNYDYYLEAFVPVECTDGEGIHSTVLSDTFVPLVAKLDDSVVDASVTGNALVFNTSSSEYAFPLIKEGQKVKSVDKIDFNFSKSIKVSFGGDDLASIAKSNAKGLLESLFSKEIQQYIYVDNKGALTFTENIYVNNFNRNEVEEELFKFLLNATQSKMLGIFGGVENVDIFVEKQDDYESPFNVCFRTDSITLVVTVQSMQKTDTFPSIKLRKLAEVTNETHVVLNKKKLDKALSRLMVFDKKFDITVMNYSKLVFGENSVKLVSIINHNSEEIKYNSSSNAFEHESVIRFADLVNQLKAIDSDTIDISYGKTPAIAINSNIIQLIPEIQVVKRD